MINRAHGSLVAVVGIVAAAAMITSACSSSKAKSSTSSSASASSPSASASSSSASSTGPQTAIAAVTDYFAALKANNCTLAYTYLTAPLSTNFGSAAKLCQSAQLAPTLAFTVGTVSAQTTASAKVAATVTLGGGSAGTHSDTVTVLNQNGVWLVSSIARA